MRIQAWERNIYIYIYIKQLNRDPLNVTFHASAGHITIIRSITPDIYIYIYIYIYRRVKLFCCGYSRFGT